MCNQSICGTLAGCPHTVGGPDGIDTSVARAAAAAVRPHTATLASPHPGLAPAEAAIATVTCVDMVSRRQEAININTSEGMLRDIVSAPSPNFESPAEIGRTTGADLEELRAQRSPRGQKTTLGLKHESY